MTHMLRRPAWFAIMGGLVVVGVVAADEADKPEVAKAKVKLGVAARETMAATEPEDTHLARSTLRADIALALGLAGDKSAAKAELEKAADERKRIENPKEGLAADFELAKAAARIGDRELCGLYLQKVEQGFTETDPGQPQQRLFQMLEVARQAVRVNDRELAMRQLAACRDWMESKKNTPMTMAATPAVAATYRAMGDDDDAGRMIDKALELAADIKDRNRLSFYQTLLSGLGGLGFFKDIEHALETPALKEQQGILAASALANLKPSKSAAQREFVDKIIELEEADSAPLTVPDFSKPDAANEAPRLFARLTAMTNLASALAKLDRAEASEKVLEPALKNPRLRGLAFNSVVELALAWERAGEHERARKLLLDQAKSARDTPMSGVYLGRLATAQAKIGEADDAIESIDSVKISEEPARKTEKQTKGLTLDRSEVEKAFKASALGTVATALVKKDRKDDARKRLKEANELFDAGTAKGQRGGFLWTGAGEEIAQGLYALDGRGAINRIIEIANRAQAFLRDGRIRGKVSELCLKADDWESLDLVAESITAEDSGEWTAIVGLLHDAALDEKIVDWLPRIKKAKSRIVVFTQLLDRLNRLDDPSLKDSRVE